MQAVGFSSTIVVSNCFVLGVNPVGVYRRFRQQWNDEDEMIQNMIVTDTDAIPGLAPGTKYNDLPDDLKDIMYNQSMTTVILVDLVKALGLSDKTILVIEKDLRNQNLAAIQVEREEKRKVKDSALLMVTNRQ